MQPIAINLWALIACVVVRFVVGGLWYSPILFMKAFQAETGVTDAALKPRMPAALGSDLIGAILMAFVLAHIVRYAGASTAVMGAVVGLACWVGFVATTSMARQTYEGARWRLFMVSGGYNLATLLIMGAILGGWG